MGQQHKLIAPLAGAALVTRIVDAALAANLCAVTVVTGAAALQIESALAGRELNFEHNPAYADGLASSLKRGLDSLPEQLDGVMILLADMPLISCDHLNHLLAQFERGSCRDIVVPEFAGRQGNPVIWPVACIASMMQLAGDRGARNLLQQYAERIRRVSMSDDAVCFDVDTPARLEEARVRLNALPRIAAYKPQYLELEKGKTYLWCSCGLSKNQPFCDQSHRDTAFKPVRYVAEQASEEVLFCNCKHTADGPFCDGAHNNLKDGYDEDDPDSEENRRIAQIAAGADGVAMLDGGCYVARVQQLAMETRGNLKIGAVITAATGASYQSQFYAQVEAGCSPVMAFGDRHVVVLVSQGEGLATISGRDFNIVPESGFYVRPGEAFRVQHSGSAPMKLFVSVCPLADRAEILDQMPANFDSHYPVRTVAIDEDNRQSMADRFFQILVDKQIGSTVVTQFIGEVPFSKAAMHRHLYEESIVVLRGAGCMWTQGLKTPVAAGDVIFLPRKQIHSLQCTDPAGMMLAGVIYPGDNPSINY
jgi:CTP:molybdopterin cytidylyltransferase MocA/CDGSH-type Zn-finger protein/quercetin dioxygenase-like cupin family protein